MNIIYIYFIVNVFFFFAQNLTIVYGGIIFYKFKMKMDE